MALWPTGAPAQGQNDLASFNAYWFGGDLGYDVEFAEDDRTALPSGWSWANQGATSSFQFDSKLNVFVASTGGTVGGNEAHRLLTRAAPSESAWKMVLGGAEIIGKPDSWARIGLFMRESSSGKYIIFGRGTENVSTAARVQLNYWSALNTFNSEPYAQDAIEIPTFFEIQKIDATHYSFWYSVNGVNWYSVYYNLDVSGDVTAYDEVGILFGSKDSYNNGTNMSVDWLRIRT